MGTVKTVIKDVTGKVTETRETVSSESQNSAEINKTAKGEFSWKVKVYDDDDESCEKQLRNYIKRVESIIAG